MTRNVTKWSLLLGLSFIWGSSYILNKYALTGLSFIQIGVLRLLISTLFLWVIGFRTLKQIPINKWKYIVYIAMLGSFFQAFLYPLAMYGSDGTDGIDSAIASVLNSLTPFNTLIIGTVFYHFSYKKRQLGGVFLGLAGTLILILHGVNIKTEQNYFYAIYIILSSLGIAFNVNILKKYLTEIPALAVTTGVFTVLVIPSVLTLLFSGFVNDFVWDVQSQKAIFYIAILAIFGTGVAHFMYNRLAQLGSPIFTTSVSYIIPVVAIIWGLIDGEKLSLTQILATGLILIGVYLVNNNR
jgi:drug/metabolite transporter (DMT)-like permease